MCGAHRSTGAETKGQSLRPGAVLTSIEADIQRIETTAADASRFVKQSAGEILMSA